MSNHPNDRRKGQNFYKLSTLVYLFIAIIIAAGLLLTWNGFSRQQQYAGYQYELAEYVIGFSADEIEGLIKDQNHKLYLFVQHYAEFLEESSIDNHVLREEGQIRVYLNEYFPEVLAFNIIGSNGEFLITDGDYLAGELCINDATKLLINKQDNKVYVHPQTDNFHYDLMEKISINGKSYVLVVSQKLEAIENILHNHRVHGFVLKLINNSIENLIEVTGDGVRGHNGVAIKQLKSEEESSYLSRDIANSRWRIQVGPEIGMEKASMELLIQEHLLAFAVFLCVVTLFFIYIVILNNNRIKLFWQVVKKEDSLNEQNLNMPLPYESVDDDLNIIVVNRAWCEMLGYEEQEVTGQPLLNFYFPDSYQNLITRMQEYKEHGGINHDTYLMKRKDGEKIEVDVFSRFNYDENNKFQSTRSILIDLTESSKASIYLRTLEQRHLLHWQQTVVGVIEWDSDFRVLDWNPAAEKIFGFSMNEVSGKKPEDFFILNPGKSELNGINKNLLYQMGGTVHEINENLTKDGRVLVCEWFNTRLTDDSGNVVGVSSLVLDITMQQKELVLIEQHEMELRQLIDSMVDAVFTLDESCNILSFNKSAENMFGYDANDVIGCNLNILIPLPDYTQNGLYLLKYITGKKGEIINKTREVDAKRKSGEVFPMRMSVSELPHQSARGRCFVASCNDISDQLRMAAVIRQSRKLDAIGSMAGGIAHDFNNLLGIISGDFEILKRYAGDNVDMTKWIDSGLRTTKRGATLTKRLLGFSRIDAGTVNAVAIRTMLYDMHSVIEKTAGVEIEIFYDFDDDIWLTDIDLGEIEDALINLVINARDAIDGKGRIDFTLRNKTIDCDKPNGIPDGREGDYVVLCISDTGCGIDKESQERIFDPFYTTKEKGKGTGLGLSMVHGSIRRSKGFIDVVSPYNGSGSAFYLYLPRSEKKTEDRYISEASEALPTGTETILVVDDEVDLVEVATFYLADLGYKVLQATGIEQAISILQSDERIDVLFSDIIMPGGIDGIGLSEVAKELRPEIKILLVTGYNPNDTSSNALAKQTRSMCLNKPYNRADVSRALKTVLEGGLNA